MPYKLFNSAMAESPDGRGVLLFGGEKHEDIILEFRAGASSWIHLLNITLQEGRSRHTVIPIQ